MCFNKKARNASEEAGKAIQERERMLGEYRNRS
jgi:hypothetical protein